MPEPDLDRHRRMPSLTPTRHASSPSTWCRPTAARRLTGREGPPRRRLGSASAGWRSSWLVLVVLLALLAPVLPIDDPNEAPPRSPRQPPGTDGHILGGDGLGPRHAEPA